MNPWLTKHAWLVFNMSGPFWDEMNVACYNADGFTTDESMLDFDLAYCGGGPL